MVGVVHVSNTRTSRAELQCLIVVHASVCGCLHAVPSQRIDPCSALNPVNGEVVLCPFCVPSLPIV